MSFRQFVLSPKGEKIAPILRDGDAIRRMEKLSQSGRPALLAVADRIGKVVPVLTDTEKQHVGRWVHRLLGPRGWRPVEKKRMPKGGLFTTAAVYGRVQADEPPPPVLRPAAAQDAASRLRRAREQVRRLPAKPQDVKAFLAQKRAAAKREL